MAGESNSIRVAILTTILTSLLLLPTPIVSANQSGVTIEGDSINLYDFQTMDESYFNLQFNLSATNDGMGENYVGQIYTETSAIDGTILSNTSITFDLDDGDVELISSNLSSLNYGYTIVTVGLTGDLGIESGNQLLSFQRTIHRLKPLNISIAGSSSIIVESVDSTGMMTENNSLSDGDYVQLQIPIVNEGDYNWTGNLSFLMDNGVSLDEQTSEPLNVLGMSTQIVFFNSTLQVYEGLFSISFGLNGSVDDYIQDNYQNFTVYVNPPPLPILSTVIDFDSQGLTSGETIEMTLTNFNNGTIDFSGDQTCIFNDEVVYNSSINIFSLSSIVTNFSIYLKPGELFCFFSGQRLDENSMNNASVDFELESALFEYAGSFTPSTTDGPWHIGDDATFSLLVRNTGTKQGNVTLRMESSTGNYQGNFVALEPDQAGEVTITVPLLVSGTESLNWSLYTIDGDIAAGITGVVSLPISVRQSFDLSLYEITWTTEEGLSAKWALNLSSGIDREMNVKLGYGTSSQDTYVYDVNMIVSAGQTSGSINFGFVDRDYVIIRAQEVNWTAESSFSSFTKSIPQDRPEYEFAFNLQSNPNRPVSGESASVSLIIENKGNIIGVPGTIILFDSDGTKLGESTTSKLNAGSKQTVSFNLIWPEGDEVKLRAKWDFGGESKLVEQNFLSTITTHESSEEFSIPWAGILGGLAVSALIILIVRIKGDSTKPTKKKAENKTPGSKSKTLSEIKIEIGCPVCSRQLRVPENYSGSVKCPDCSNSFTVDPNPEHDSDANGNENVEEVVQEKSDGKKEISCPECSQSLRIPESYDGSVRCPSCKMIFKSKDG